MEDNSTELDFCQSPVEIKAQEPPFLFKKPHEQNKFPFLKFRSRERRSDTWLIAVFVILYILAFITTMILNNCWKNSHGDCALPMFRIVSFQRLSENPLLGPSASTLDKMGALRRTFLLRNHDRWRLFISPWLHAGAFHLIINIICIIFVGMRLERDFGPLRITVIYLLSTFFGSLLCALFVRDSPVVTSSAALFGLLGAKLSGLIWSWNVTSNKFRALAIIFVLSATNLLLCLLPYIDNFGNIGAFLSGLLLGFGLLFTPRPRQMSQNKADFYEYNTEISIRFSWKPDRPTLRGVSLGLFSIVFASCLAAVLLGMDINQYCGWCRFVDCIPSGMWRCNDMTTACETMESNAWSTLTCMSNGKFKLLPYTNISETRIMELCTMLCG